MLNSAHEIVLTKIISWGAALTTILIVSGSVTDPVNVTKLVSLGVSSLAAFGMLAMSSIMPKIREFYWEWMLVAVFLLASFFSVIQSDSPVSQGLYGSYGRNNGFITYLFLSLLLLSVLSLKSRNSYKTIIKALLFAGLVNIAYCLWVIMYGDFINWNNPYGNILGTLGNPNFIGAFLGIFIAAYLGFGLDPSASKWFKYSMFIVIPVTGYEIVDSHAIQGRVVGAAGLGIVCFFFLRARFNLKVALGFMSVGVVAGTFSLLGAFQIGPLSSFIYKTSVSLRGQYWLAGWRTGDSHPFTGVGMDAFGDWYRRTRDVHALELPGINTVVNASHNVPIDMFAFGGWPLFISYILIMGLGGRAVIRASLRAKHYDPILAVLVSSWTGYQLQSIISINQIGLAVWGWLLTGAVIGYEKITRNSSVASGNKVNIVRDKLQKAGQEAKPILFGSIFALIGLVISIPPLAADAKWRSAQLARTSQAIETSMKPSVFNPQNSVKYMTNIQTLEQSQLFELAHKYALEAVKWNPESFELWKLVYLVRDSTPEERALALSNLKRLDPLNPDVTSIK
jgi:hypothetical protein